MGREWGGELGWGWYAGAWGGVQGHWVHGHGVGGMGDWAGCEIWVGFKGVGTGAGGYVCLTNHVNKKSEIHMLHGDETWWREGRGVSPSLADEQLKYYLILQIACYDDQK